MDRAPSPRHKAILFLTTLVAVAVTYLWHRLPIDDAYITYRYAANLNDGVGFVYNVGEWVLGTTTPLWGLLLSLAGSLGFDIESTSLIFGAIFTALTVALFLAFVPEGVGLPQRIAWGALAVAYNPLTVVTYSGMETAAYSLAVGVGLYCFGRKFYLAGAALAAVATLLRPDGFLVGAAALIAAFGSPPKQWARSIVMYLALILPFAVAGYTMYGTPLPHSIEAKQILYPAGPLMNLLYFCEALSQTPLDAVLLCLGGAGLLLVWADTRLRPFVVWAVLYSAGIIFSGVKPLFFWYFGPLWLLFVTVGFEGLRRQFATRMSLSSSLALVAVPVLIALFIAFDTVPRAKGLDAVEIRENAYREIVRKYGPQIEDGSGGTSVLVGETGILGYGLPHAYIIDSSGIASPGVKEILRDLRSATHEVIDLHRDTPWAKAVIDAYKPEWIIGARGRMQLAVLEDEPWFTGLYQRIDLLAPDELGGIGVYKRVPPTK